MESASYLLKMLALSALSVLWTKTKFSLYDFGSFTTSKQLFYSLALTRNDQRAPPTPKPTHLAFEMDKRPSTIVVSASAIAFGTIGYLAALVLINKYVPILIETELSETLNRKVSIGQVHRLWLTGFRIGSSSIQTTPTKSNYVSLPAIEVSLNPLPLLQGRALLAENTLVEPNIYIQQDKSGELIDTDDVKEIQLPVPIDTSIRVTKGEIALLPSDRKTQLTLQLEGTVAIPYG